MREYALSQTLSRLHHLAAQIAHLKETEGDQDAEAIHGLRVAIRRLRQCLVIFREFYPDKSWKKVRRELAGVMRNCAEVRDRDIVLGLLSEAGVAADSPLVVRLHSERRAGDRALRRELARWTRRGHERKLLKAVEA